MMYTKIKPEIDFIEFIKLIAPVAYFNSLEGEEYVVKKLQGSVMHFIRKSSGKLDSMELRDVLKAYKELTEFKTENFKPFVPFTHSPALGLLLHIKLLKK